MNNTENDSDEELLRHRAIGLLGINPSLRHESDLSETKLMKLFLELEIHQVELEMQNEELKLAKSATQDATDKYIELYDFAPSGYFTLTKIGEIIEVNLRGANMLNRERHNLQNSQFGFFVTNETKQVFNTFLETVFNSNKERNCVVDLLSEDNLPIQVFLNGVITKKGGQCLLIVVDISEHLKLIALQKKADKLEMNNMIMQDRLLQMTEFKKEINALLKKSGEAEKYVID